MFGKFKIISISCGSLWELFNLKLYVKKYLSDLYFCHSILPKIDYNDLKTMSITYSITVPSHTGLDLQLGLAMAKAMATCLFVFACAVVRNRPITKQLRQQQLYSSTVL